MSRFIYTHIASFLLGLVVTWIVFSIFFLRSDKSMILTTIREQNGQYPFISRLLDIENTEQTSDAKMALLKKRIEDYIRGLKEKTIVSHVSVYIRDLKNGPWIGIDEKEPFKPASLLKVPIMMAIYKQADKNKQILEQKIHINNPDSSIIQTIVPSQQVNTKTEYTTEQLIERMIVYSDNIAKDTLVTQLKDVQYEQVFYDLGLDVPGVRGVNEDVAVNKYASFFRILYNASYLSPELSNRALELLSRSEFKDGLVAGVPKEVVVAHKFGEREFVDSNEKQLHDCGIVYTTRSPYLICVMTRGVDMRSLMSSIAFISKLTYEELK